VDQFMVSVLGKSGSVYDERKHASEQIKCKRCLPPQIRLGGIFFTDVRAKIPLALEYAGFFLIPERR